MKDDPIIRKIRQRHSNIPQDGLFEIEPEQPKQSEEPQKRTAKPKTVGSVSCPACMNKRVGVIKVWRDGQDCYVIRDHDRITRSSHRFPCPASGVEVLDFAPSSRKKKTR